LIEWRLSVFDELGSTSDYCVAAAHEGAAEGLAVLALRQTAGRGSRGRQWQAPEGNLNLSLLLRPNTPARRAGLYSLLTGVAVVEALAELAAPTATLKWPNDVLIGGDKVAGILIDAVPAGMLLNWLVIGIGVNLANAPEIAGRRTTSLAAHGLYVSATAFADILLSRLALWAEASDDAIRAAWLDHAHAVGTPLEVRGMGTTMSGRFAGLTETGELRLSTDDGIRIVSTGEILLGQG